MKISVLTLGCRTNQAESASVEEGLHTAGHQLVSLSDAPDLCIINTCTVTAKADYQSRQLINRALRQHAKVIVTGCYAELQLEHLRAQYPGVEFVKNKLKDSIINMIQPTTSSDCQEFKGTRHRPIFKVQDGCNFLCSYCTIPMARGRSRSSEAAKIVQRIQKLESQGFHEAVLSGIHLGSYGRDLDPQQSLPQLLEAILKGTEKIRIRLSSLEVREIGEDLIALMRDSRVCKHLHIPLQSGDERVLSLMNRAYTLDEFKAAVEMVLTHIPGIALGTDVIVGFPGEGEQEFTSGLATTEAIPFAYMHIFPYSKRPGTKAVRMPDHVPEQIKKERVAVLTKVAQAKRRNYIEKQVGRTLAVIIEEVTKNSGAGTSDNYIKVSAEGSDAIVEGMLANIRVAGHKGGVAFGQLIKK